MELTLKQQQALEVYERVGTYKGGARELGMSRQGFTNIVNSALKNKAMHTDAEPGYFVNKRTICVDADGEVERQWIKVSLEAETLQAIIDTAVKAFEDTLPREKPVKLKEQIRSEDLLNCYILTDYHLGMYSWGEETGEDWDTEIAEQALVNWISAGIEQSPKAEKAVLANIGDFLHWDGLEAVTPQNRNILDADTRFQRLIRVAIRVLRRIIRLLLKKYSHVHIVMADANHDPAGEAWLREMFHVLYEDEPRITVDRSPDSYYCYEHGLTSLFFHHGHKRKVANVDDVFAQKFREVFGRTKHSYAHMGHRHHEHALETNLMIVRQHRTLAAKDAYASKGGWMSGRSADVLTYHKEYGEVGRVSIAYEMISPE